ncbi:calmodulin N-methyltransferase [Salix suchowensis]|nr:calmodulin N-methyltransferase [Salix suchowensis]
MIMLKPVEGEDAEDILADSLDTLYECQPVSLSSPGRHFVLQLNHRNHSTDTLSIEPRKPISISCRVPDTQSSNWSLHASSVWVASVYLTEHIQELHLEDYLSPLTSPANRINVLELGAGAGIPSIAISKLIEDSCIHITSSDYPDDQLISALEDNVQTNDVASKCKVVPYAWGSTSETTVDRGFDVVIAADTLWNSDTHAIFVETLQKTLKKDAKSRIHLVAGLHTGRFTIQSMLDRLKSSGFDVESAEERQVHGDQRRGWIVERTGKTNLIDGGGWCGSRSSGTSLRCQ